MGLFDKVKNILFDEEEVELPEIKKEPKKPKFDSLEEENPIKEIKVPKDDFSDREYKSETTFTFPIDFDDDEPVKEEPKPIIKEKKEEYRPVYKTPEKRDYSDYLRKTEKKKQFKPTPIISPVYGVLDQNYKKEDVIVKKEVLRKPNELSLEEVRKRAFGTLEDEIEQNLTSDTKEIKITEEVKIKKEIEVETKPKIETVEEPVDKMKTIGELIEEDNHTIDIPEIDSIDMELNEYNNDEEPQKRIDDLLSHNEEIDVEEKETIEDDEIDDEEADLFSLIDSMYEEKGD